jgi:DNA-binding response OmpR family regulator
MAIEKINILVVEDEALVALEIKRAIDKIGFTIIDMVTNYDDALKSIKENNPDLILLDINLKNSCDGIEIAKQTKDTPIVYLTAYTDDETLQRAMQTNPIGYLVKPFKREDLKSVLFLSLYKLKQHPSITTSLMKLGNGYCYDTENRNLFFNDFPIKLSSKEKTLLELLIEARETIIPFGVLEEHIWGGNPVSEGSLRVLLHRLRGKMEYKLIETIPSFGCRLRLPN